MKTFTNKELKRAGIYSITNNITGKVYYGNTSNLYNRLMSHVTAFGRGIHSNPSLREDSKTQSGCDFSFRVLHFEDDATWRYDLEKAYILQAKEKYNTVPSLIKFVHGVTSIKGKIKYAETKNKDYDSFLLCKRGI